MLPTREGARNASTERMGLPAAIADPAAGRRPDLKGEPLPRTLRRGAAPPDAVFEQECTRRRCAAQRRRKGELRARRSSLVSPRSALRKYRQRGCSESQTCCATGARTAKQLTRAQPPRAASIAAPRPRGGLERSVCLSMSPESEQLLCSDGYSRGDAAQARHR